MRSGTSLAPSRTRRWTPPGRTAADSPASASRTSVRPWSPGSRCPASRSTVRSSGRTAAPQPAATSCVKTARSRCSASERAAVPRANGARARSLLLGHHDGVARQRGGAGRERGIRDDRLVARVQADGPAHDGLLQRVPDTPVRHPEALLGPGALRAPVGRGGLAARPAAERPRLRRDLGVRRPGAGGRNRRRSAGRPLRAGLPRSRAGEERLRDRELRAGERGRRGTCGARELADHGGPGSTGACGLCAGGGDLHNRRGCAVAAGRPRDHRCARGDRGARAVPGLQRRRLPGPRLSRVSALPTGTPTRAERSSVSPGAPAGRIWRGRLSSRSRTRPSTPCERWKARAGYPSRS